MKLSSALHDVLTDRQIPVITEYDLFLYLYEIHRARGYKENRIHRLPHTLGRYQYIKVIQALLDSRLLRPDKDFYSGQDDDAPPPLGLIKIFRVSDVPDIPADEVTARVDPFCYISHISAMQRYGLTNRQPQTLHITTPSHWSEFRDRKIVADFGKANGAVAYHPKLLRHGWPERIRNRQIRQHETKRSPRIQPIRGSAARIAEIGETFVQMLDQPGLCGGMAHVLEVWITHAPPFVEEIIAAIDRATEKIIKVRAGYIFNEMLQISDARIEAWTQFAQRGGSRRLDPAGAYVNRYSEKWMISLNV